MSRIGKLPVELPDRVKAEVSGSNINYTRLKSRGILSPSKELLLNVIKVTGTKGSLEKDIPKRLRVKVEKDQIIVEAKTKDKQTKALHGTYRALIANMVQGVSEGWKKELELVGAGYKVEVKENTLVLIVGYSHSVELNVPEGITVKAEKTQIVIEGMDKELVGQFAAEVRAVRPPEPYKGKGIKYTDEIIRRKAGKAAKTEGAT